MHGHTGAKAHSLSHTHTRTHTPTGLHAASHALINVLPLFTRTSPNDALTICDYPAARRYRPRYLLIGDHYNLSPKLKPQSLNLRP